MDKITELSSDMYTTINSIELKRTLHISEHDFQK